MILATGSIPRAIPGVEFGGRVIGTEQAWALSELPARLAVVGAGRIGRGDRLGLCAARPEVRLIEALDHLLPAEDVDVSRRVERGFKRQGITVQLGEPISDVQVSETSVTFTHGGEPGIEADYLVICAGRGADVDGLGLAEAGVELDAQGLVKVDGALRTSRDGVYAIGDSSPDQRSRTRPPTRASSPPRTRPVMRRIRSPTWTSHVPRSARRTSAPLG